MKKLLIASTALIASTGMAAAQFEFSGSANFGVKYDDSRATDELFLFYEIDFDVVATGTTDGGLTFGASIDLDAAINSTTGEPNFAGTGTGFVDAAPGLTTTNTDDANEDFDPEVFISGGFGTLTVGNLDVATDALVPSDVGFDGIGAHDLFENVIILDVGGVFGSSSANAQYDATFGGLTVIATAQSITEDFAFVLDYDFGDFNLALGYAEEDAAGADTITVQGGASLAGFDIVLTYIDHSNAANVDVDGYGITLAYEVGAFTFTGVYYEVDIDTVNEDPSYGIGAEYDLGGGASLAAGIGAKTNLAGGTDTVGDFGIKMSF